MWYRRQIVLPAGDSCAREDHPWGERPPRVEHPLHRAHLLDPLLAVQLPQQGLLDRAAAYAVFGKRAAAKPLSLTAEFENRLHPALDLVVAPRDHVRMDVAI